MPVLTTITSPSRYISTSTCGGGYPTTARELPALSNGPQVLEICEAIRRLSSLQPVFAGTARLTIRGQACLPLTYLRCRFLFQGVEVTESGDVSRNAPVVEVAGRFVQFLVLRHRPDDAFFEPSREGLDRLALYCGLGINVENVRGTPWAVAFGEPRHSAVVQQLDPLDGSMDAVAVTNGEAREAFVFFIPRGYLLPSLLLELLKFLVEVSDGLGILLLFLEVDSVALADGLDELLDEVAEPNWVVDVEPLNDVGGQGRQYGVGAGDRHRDSGGGTGRAL